MSLIIRREEEKDHRAVEEPTREAFECLSSVSLSLLHR